MVRGKRVMLGAIDVADDAVETAQEVAQPLRNAFEYVDNDKLIASTNCGMAPFHPDVALTKLSVLSTGSTVPCEELTGVRFEGADTIIVCGRLQSNLPSAS